MSLKFGAMNYESTKQDCEKFRRMMSETSVLNTKNSALTKEAKPSEV